MNDLTERINQCFEQSGFTQYSVSKKIGITRAAMSDYCKGRVNRISGEVLLGLAAVFNVRPEWLLHGEGQKTYDSHKAYLDQYEHIISIAESLSPDNLKSWLNVGQAMAIGELNHINHDSEAV